MLFGKSWYGTGDVGLLLLRIGIGASMMIFHGYGKITAGPERWHSLGAQMQNLGISFAPTFWGFMAAASEFFGSLLIVMGLFFRPATALLAITMLVAATRHLNLPEGEPGAGWRGASHALELLAVYVALFLIGPGRYAIGVRWKRDDGIDPWEKNAAPSSEGAADADPS
ncbi:MAG: DoxX family protein [Candidatus Latescibacterota bacterium]|nr:MAG: DoxX family protein [Candidatus Latescibacterota bacterium]